MFKLIKTTISLLLHKLEKQKRNRTYIRAYKSMPETEDEIITANQSAVEAFADNPWE
jgi:hypothetical protein